MVFNYLYRTYVHDLFQFGRQYSRDWNLVKGSIQNVFIYLRKKRGELSDVTNIKGYLFRAIQREILKNIKESVSLEGFEEDFLEPHFHIEVSLEVSLINNESELERKKHKLWMVLSKILILTLKNSMILMQNFWGKDTWIFSKPGQKHGGLVCRWKLCCPRRISVPLPLYQKEA